MLNDFLSGSAAWGVLLTLAAFALGALINRITGRLQGQRRPGELPASAGHRGPGHPAV